MAGPLLFAYGTLRDALQRDVVLRGAPTREIGGGSVTGALYDLGNYPGLVLGGTADEPVPGVLVELPDDAALARLDEYEDVGNGLFVRDRVVVRRDDGGEVEAWTYVYSQPVRGRRRIAAWGAPPASS
jgi:gamma-glutamylcyclotransferase (GGCT)/AIG2-like uncharacterized protein YtfP